VDERIGKLEERVAALEREVAEIKNGPTPAPASGQRRDPLEGHPLIWKRPPREELLRHEAEMLKRLGIENLKPVGAVKLRQMLLEEGIDPNSNEFSRGIIEMREE
jgi:hypothetical protein